MDLLKLSLPELRDVAAQVATEIRQREAQNLEEARQRIAEIAKSIGLPIHELFANALASKSERATLYQHPDDKSKTWSGRGRKPQWLIELINAGRTLEELRA